MFSGITKVLKSVLGDKAARDVKAIQPIVDQINKEWESIKSISNDALREKSEDFRRRIETHLSSGNREIEELEKQVHSNPNMDILEKEAIYDQIDQRQEQQNDRIEDILNEILPEAFAVMKETARRFKEHDEVVVTAKDFDRDLAAKKAHIRIEGDKAIWKNSWIAGGNEITWDMVHYDVQLIGGIALHQGKIAEMQTGEGKTLVSTLPVYLNALAGKGVHLVTVNDYLAKRDAEWMGPLHEFHGLTVDCIDNHQPNSESRRAAYQADITYGTNNEFGFDYLRDNMTSSIENLVQRKHQYAIVDEVDSVLIDDARTPLIISGPTDVSGEQQFIDMRPIIEKLYNAQKQLVTNLLAKAKKVLKSEDEVDKEAHNEGALALFRAFRGLPKNKALIKFLSEPGVKAQLLKTEAYYLQDQSKEMPNADKELFFTIDEKNNAIELTEKGIDLISGKDDPNFFILPSVGEIIAEIDAKDLSDEEKLKEKDEMIRDYSVKAERIHTINQLLKAYTLFEKDVEYVIVDGQVKIVDEQTGRIMEGRRYSDGLHQAIESKERVKIEAATQTYATITLQNYFRMYHKLAGMTGTAETEAGEFWDIYKLDVVVIPTNKPVIRDDQEDKVYKTKREKYNAIIEEIVELRNAGRPVLVGTTAVDVSELLSRMLTIKHIDHQVLNAKLHQKEADIVAEAGKPGVVTIATNMAGRGTDIKLGPGVREAGGLAIIGTEKHDSRRIDRQLRGRSGRQGDPGSSQFYISLEDNLMRLFGSDRIAKIMDRLGLKEGEVIQHSMITRSIERAQRKVEENNFGIRKRLLEYDDVMNSQRTVIYKRRKHALFGERLKLDIANMFYDVSESIVEGNQPARDYEGFQMQLLQYLGVQSPVEEEAFESTSSQDLIQLVYQSSNEHYNSKNEMIARNAYPTIKRVYEDPNNAYQNILVPFGDGRKMVQIAAPLEESYNSKGAELINAVEKSVTLSVIDDLWKEHLREMDDLRQSVQSAVYEQKDPLLIYKFESYELFKKVLDRINADTIAFLAHCNLPMFDAQQAFRKGPLQKKDDLRNIQTSKTEIPGYAQSSSTGEGYSPDTRERVKPQPVTVEKKVGRNDPCPCGSGKKYKQCHGK
jgi:preprotein translocase subunit SecA